MMKPVIFDYAFQQKPNDFDNITYSYDDDINIVDGKSLVESSRKHSVYMTKTNTVRESDDNHDHKVMGLITKTDVVRESDDDLIEKVISSKTKTLIAPNTDNAGIDALQMLLTKTEVAREKDE